MTFWVLKRRNSIDCFIVIALFLFFFSSCATPMHSFIVKAPAKSGIVVNSITVGQFTQNSRRNNQYALQLKTIIENRIANEGYITVKHSHAQALLKGNAVFGKIETDSYTTKYKGKEKTYYTYHYVKKLTVTGNYSIIDSNQQAILTGDSFEINFKKEWRSSKNRRAAKACAYTNEKIYNEVLQQIAQKIITEISPHQETVKRQLEDGGDSNIGLGVKYLKNGRTDQAISIWDNVIKNSENNNDKAAAYYNIGVIKEAQRLYRDAFELFSNANSLNFEKELYMQAMTRVENAKKRDDVLKSQVKGN